MNTKSCLRALLTLGGAVVAQASWAANWVDLTTVSSTMGITQNYLCAGGADGTDIGCPTNAPYLSSGGLLGIGLTPTTQLEVSGTISATHFVGDGSGLTGVTAASIDRITSGTTALTANSTDYISITNAGTTTGYFDSTGRLITPGISVTTNQLSATTAYFSGNVGIGTSTPTKNLDIAAMGDSGMGGGPAVSLLSANGFSNARRFTWLNVFDATSNMLNLNLQNDAGTNVRTVLTARSSGNVGIGTTAPGGKLDVHSTDTTNGPSLSNDDGAIFSARNDYGNQALQIGNYTSSPYGIWQQVKAANNSGVAYPLILNPLGGNVGIGITSPNAKLDVGGGISATGLSIGTAPITALAVATIAGTPGAPNTSGVTQTNGSLRLAANTANSQVLDLGIYNASPWGSWIQASNGGDLASNSPLAINPNGGNVGIATTTPSTTLHVSGTIRIADGGEACDTNRAGAIKYAGGTFYFCAGSSWQTFAATAAAGGIDRITSGTTAVTANSTHYISITNAGTTTGYFDSTGRLITPGISVTTNQLSATTAYFSGKVGIGTTAPTYSLETTGQFKAGSGSYYNVLDGSGLHVVNPTGGTPTLRLTQSGVADWSIYTLANTGTLTFNDKLAITTSGNVGIGTTAPSTTLHVSGTLRLSDGGETCDTNRAGAIKYTGGTFYFCAGSSWQTLAATAGGGTQDRIVSTSANVVAGNGGTISFTTGGVSGTAYIDTAGRFVAAGVSTTGGISGTTGYFSGNVGIGTSAPKANIHIQQASTYVEPTLGTNPSATLFLAGHSEAYGLYAGVAGTGNVWLQSMRNDAATAYAITLNPNGGNVGIGTTAPSVTLDIHGASSDRGDSFGTLHLADEAYGADNGGSISFGIANAAKAGARIQFLLGNTNGTDQFGGLGFQTRSTYGGTLQDRVRITYDGLVGIGATAPSTTLHVSGTLRIADGGESCDTNRAGAIKYASGTFHFCSGSAWETVGDLASAQADRITSGTTNVYARSDGSISFTTAGTTTGYFYGGKLVAGGVSTTGGISGTTGYFSGQVGIENVNPLGRLTVGSGDEAITFDNHDIGTGMWIRNDGFNSLISTNVGDMFFGYGGNTKNIHFHHGDTGLASLYINTAGNIGIGTTAPSSSLSVHGAASTPSLNPSTSALTNWSNSLTNLVLSIDDNTPFTASIQHKHSVLSGAYYPIALNPLGGNVGIGTASPVGLLHLYTSAPQITLQSGYGTAGILQDNTTANTIFANDVGGFTFKTGTTWSGSLVNTGTERLRITNAGLVGIATTAPSTTLHVNGTLRLADGGEACDSNRAGAIKYTGGTFYFCDGTSGWQSFTAMAGGAQSDRITSGTAYVRADLDTGATVSGTLTISDTAQQACSASNPYALRVNSTTGKLEICRP